MLNNLLKFSWRNLWRNPRRTLVTVFAITCGISVIVFAKSYILGISNGAADALTKTEIGHIRIAHREFLRLERIMPKENLLEDSSALKILQANQKDIMSIQRKIKFNGLLNYNSANQSVIAVGIEPDSVDQIMNLSAAIQQGKYLKSGGLNLIIGTGLAAKLSIKVGDEILFIASDINYSTYALPFTIAGIFETGFSNYDKHTVFMPLEKAQEMLDCPGKIHEYLLYLKDQSLAIAIAGKIKQDFKNRGISSDIAVIPWQHHDMVKNLMPYINMVYDWILYIIMGVVGLVILNTMLMSVVERNHEIGVIKALGFNNLDSFLMIVMEALYLGCIGSVGGGIIGSVLSIMVEKHGINFSKMLGPGMLEKIDMPIPFLGSIIYPDYQINFMLGAMAFGLIATLLAVLYPACKSSRMLPVEAFRSRLNV